jgi:L-fucose mutarotase
VGEDILLGLSSLTGVEKYSFYRKGPTLLKNLSPLLSGALLSALDSMQDGDTLTLVGSGYPEESLTTPIVHLGEDVTTEAAAEAILSVFPLDTADPSPIVFLDLAGEPYDVPDVAFAVNGIASDAELRRIPMTRLDLEPFVELASHSAVIVRVGSDAPPCAFLFRRGTL